MSYIYLFQCHDPESCCGSRDTIFKTNTLEEMFETINDEHTDIFNEEDCKLEVDLETAKKKFEDSRYSVGEGIYMIELGSHEYYGNIHLLKIKID